MGECAPSLSPGGSALQLVRDRAPRAASRQAVSLVLMTVASSFLLCGPRGASRGDNDNEILNQNKPPAKPSLLGLSPDVLRRRSERELTRQILQAGPGIAAPSTCALTSRSGPQEAHLPCSEGVPGARRPGAASGGGQPVPAPAGGWGWGLCSPHCPSSLQGLHGLAVSPSCRSWLRLAGECSP